MRLISIMMVLATAVMLLTLVGCGALRVASGSHAGQEAALTGSKVTWEAATRELKEGAEWFSAEVNSKVGKNIVRKSDEETVEDASKEHLKKLAEEAVKEAGEHCLEKAMEGEECWKVLPEQEREQTLEQAIESVHEAAEDEYTQRIFEDLEEEQREEALENAIATLELGAANNVGTAPPTASASPTTTATQPYYVTRRPVEGTVYTAEEPAEPLDSVTVTLYWENADGRFSHLSSTSTDAYAQYSWAYVETRYIYKVCAQSSEIASGRYWYGCGLWPFYLSPYISGPVKADVIMQSMDS